MYCGYSRINKERDWCLMKRILFSCGVVAVSFCTIATVRVICAQPPEPAMYACLNPTDQSGKKCKTVETPEGVGKCAQHTVEICSESLGGKITPASSASMCMQCANGTCICAKVVEEMPYGRCEDDSNAGYSTETCTQCAVILCAKGIGYPTIKKCQDDVDACIVPFWAQQTNACKP